MWVIRMFYNFAKSFLPSFVIILIGPANSKAYNQNNLIYLPLALSIIEENLHRFYSGNKTEKHPKLRK